MILKIGDRVKLTVDADSLDRLNLKQTPLNNKIAKISQVYNLDYAPDQTLYKVILEEPVEHEGEIIEEVFDLTDIEVKPYDIVEKRVTTFSRFIKESKKKPKWYVGLADCHGVESFIEEPFDEEHLSGVDRLHDLGLVDTEAPTRKDITKDYNQQLHMLSLRAMHNSQRHPVVYRVLLSEDSANLIQNLIDSQDYKKALITIKNLALETQLARGQGGNLEKRWKMIPNPKLDPFS